MPGLFLLLLVWLFVLSDTAQEGGKQYWMREDAGPSAEVYGAQCTSAKLNYQKQYIQSL